MSVRAQPLLFPAWQRIGPVTLFLQGLCRLMAAGHPTAFLRAGTVDRLIRFVVGYRKSTVEIYQ